MHAPRPDPESLRGAVGSGTPQAEKLLSDGEFDTGTLDWQARGLGNIVSVVPLRLFTWALEGCDNDADEATVRSIFGASATPYTGGTEPQSRKAAEARG